MMEFQQIIDRALQVRRLYEEKEARLYGSPWTSEEVALGFVGDVGDLVKLVAAAHGRRTISDSRLKLEHELADCLWSVIVLSTLHGVNLERSFLEAMDHLEKHLLEV